MKIGKNEIDESSLFIIAEVGINHNGEIEKALEMIETAKEAGVDCVKFQTFCADEFIVDKTELFTYQSQGKSVTEPMIDMFRRYELKREDWFTLKQKCKELDITFMSTPQNSSDLDILLEVGIDAIKVGSDDFTNLPLIKRYVETGLPIILSIGMANLGEVYETLKVAKVDEGYPVILLLCTSQYPTPPEDVNLRQLNTLRAAFPDLTLGFSDHTQGPLAASLAVAFGARVFEKHFTLDNNLPGPDHWFSENPESLKIWASSIKESFKLLGSPKIEPTKEEVKMKKLARRSIVSLKKVEKGETFSIENLGMRRPGDGLEPKYFEKIIGLKASRTIEKGEQIKFGDFCHE